MAEPLSLRKLDNFFSKDRRIIKSLLYEENTHGGISNPRTYTYRKKILSRNSSLNYDGNTLFDSFGKSFYNPFFSTGIIFEDEYNEMNDEDLLYGYLSKSNRDIITLPVFNLETINNSGIRQNLEQKIVSDDSIFGNYVGKDESMNNCGYVLRSDSHYIMPTIENNDNIIDDSALRLVNDNNASVYYYIPFMTDTMYQSDNWIRNTVLSIFNDSKSEHYTSEIFPSGWVNIIIGPADVFSMGQTNHALLDFSPLIFNIRNKICNKTISGNNIKVVLRMACKDLIVPTQNISDFSGNETNIVYNKINGKNNRNNLFLCNVSYNDMTRNNYPLKICSGYDLYNSLGGNNTNIIAIFDIDLDKLFEYRNYQYYYDETFMIHISWRWGLQFSPFEKVYFHDNHTSGDLYDDFTRHRENFYNPFLEVNINSVYAQSTRNCSVDITSIPNIKNFKNL